MPHAELSGIAAEAIGYAMTHGGELVRMKGGRWTYPGCPVSQGFPEWYASTTTVQAIIARGFFEVVGWETPSGIRERHWKAADDQSLGYPIRVRVNAIPKPQRWMP